MLPKSSVEEETIGKETLSDKAVRLDFEKKQIGEVIEGKDALEQWVRINLMTQRYKYPIFPHSFGVDVERALEEGYIKAIGIIKNEITESLMCHSKIKRVEDFVFEKKGTKVMIKFTVKTEYGDLKFEREVG